MSTWLGHRVLESFSSVAQLCPTLCDPMDCSMPGFPVHHQLPELTQTHVHPHISSSVIPFSSCLQSFPASGSFPRSQFFASDGQGIGASASASVLPMNIQGWFPSGLIGLISLLFKGVSRIFSNTTVQKHQFFSTQHSLWSNSDIHTWLLEKTIALARRTFVDKVMSLVFNMLSRLVITFLPRSESEVSRSVLSDSLRPSGLQPNRLPHPWDSPGKNTGVSCRFLLQGIFPIQGSNPGLLHWRQTL